MKKQERARESKSESESEREREPDSASDLMCRLLAMAVWLSLVLFIPPSFP